MATDTGEGASSSKGEEETDQPLTKDQVQTMITDGLKEASGSFREAIGLHEGQRIDQVVHGVTKKLFDTPDGKSVAEHLTESIANALKPTETPPENADKGDKGGEQNKALMESVEALTESVKGLQGENQQMRVEKTETNRVTSVRAMLDKKGIDPKLVASLNSLVANGLADTSLPKPLVGAEGQLVMESPTGPVSFEGALDKYLESNPHWVGEHRASGSGATGGDTPPVPGTVPTGASGEEFKKRSALATSNPEEVAKAMAESNAKLGQQFPGVLPK